MPVVRKPAVAVARIERAVRKRAATTAVEEDQQEPVEPSASRPSKRKTYTIIAPEHPCYSLTDTRIRLCTSGFSYKHWHEEGSYYSGLPTSAEFEAYSSDFNCVELNASFYRWFEEETFRKWGERASAVRPSFEYVVKAPRTFTHMKRLNVDDAFRDSWERWWPRCLALGSHLGPVLFQLPANLARTSVKKVKGADVTTDNLENLKALGSVLPRDKRFVFEFRDSSWFVPEVYEVLRQNNWCLALVDVRTGNDEERWCAALHEGSNPRAEDYPLHICSWGLYLRFHGAAGKYVGAYGKSRMAWWAQKMQDWAASGRTVYAAFNNTDDGVPPSAIADCRHLAASLRRLHVMN